MCLCIYKKKKILCLLSVGTLDHPLPLLEYLNYVKSLMSFEKNFILNSSVARTCNLILIVLDVLKPLGHKKIIENELEGFGIRLNSKPPNIGFKKKDKGGINFTATVSGKGDMGQVAEGTGVESGLWYIDIDIWKLPGFSQH